MTGKSGQHTPRERDTRKPSLSIIVVVYNMSREAPRTLFSLSSRYQRHIDADDYEVIVVDNGSAPPLDRAVIDNLEGHFRLIRIDPASPSPAHAVNRGLAEAKGAVVGVMIDGARLVTPGLLHFARHAAQVYDNAVVATLGWYLGHDLQRMSVQAGYDQNREDCLLASIGWPEDGYRLFEIAALDESSLDGWFYPTQESNALFLKREIWEKLEGFDERFDAPGGGLVNLDTFRRAIEMPNARLVRLLGEGTFHQLPGGTATNAPIDQLHPALARWNEQYTAIRGGPFTIPIPANEPTYIGVLPRPMLVRFLRSALDPVWPTIWTGMDRVEPPLGRHFDRTFWSCGTIPRAGDPTIAAALDLAHEEFDARRYDAVASIARLISSRDSTDRESRRLLALVCGWNLEGEATGPRSPRYHRAVSKAYAMFHESGLATAHSRLARMSHLKNPTKMVAGWIVTLLSALAHPLSSHERELLRVRLKTTLRDFGRKFLRDSS
jgi:hypothetical protein